MLEIQENGVSYSPLKVEGQKEIIILSNAFNNMITEIRSLMERILREQKEKRKTEFIALQTQINPHFLYNTLDSIIYLSEKNLNEQVVEMIVALSKYFRISISKGKSIITVKEELEHARNYLLIQKIRYSSKFDYSFIIDENVNDVKAVKLILQPLIENAIYHGISSDDDGIIIIRAYQKEDLMVFEVENNGYGLTDSQIEGIYENMKSEINNTSIGLKNVYQRIKLYYGEMADLEIISELDEKTIIKLTYPLKAKVK
jgi:two-component system sensor histidine kinase YesM